MIEYKEGSEYHSELPDAIFDFDLSPAEFRLWCYYNRVGECALSAEATAKEAGVSVGTVSKGRKSLHDKGLVDVVWGGVGPVVLVGKSYTGERAEQPSQKKKLKVYRSGWIYVLKISNDNLYKIGMTTKTPSERLSQFVPKMPYEATTVYTKNVCNVLEVEKSLHDFYKDFREAGEWFRLSNDLLNDLIQYLEAQKGISA